MLVLTISSEQKGLNGRGFEPEPRKTGIFPLPQGKRSAVRVAAIDDLDDDDFAVESVLELRAMLVHEHMRSVFLVGSLSLRESPTVFVVACTPRFVVVHDASVMLLKMRLSC